MKPSLQPYTTPRQPAPRIMRRTPWEALQAVPLSPPKSEQRFPRGFLLLCVVIVVLAGAIGWLTAPFVWVVR